MPDDPKLFTVFAQHMFVVWKKRLTLGNFVSIQLYLDIANGRFSDFQVFGSCTKALVTNRSVIGQRRGGGATLSAIALILRRDVTFIVRRIDGSTRY